MPPNFRFIVEFLISSPYIELFEKITEQNFKRVDTSNLLERVKVNIEKAL